MGIKRRLCGINKITPRRMKMYTCYKWGFDGYWLYKQKRNNGRIYKIDHRDKKNSKRIKIKFMRNLAMYFKEGFYDSNHRH
jgi:hypothetical protein